jgi:3'-phosphoadenosine 5'-phosphosulfate sulfotransferase (PAPS reductase)/FAD synthetase
MATTPDLTSDIVLINTSAGKDSEAMLAHLYDLHAQGAFGPDAILLGVHADLERSEWEGTRELAVDQGQVLDVPVVSVRRRGTWDKGNKNRSARHLDDLPAQVRFRRAQLLAEGKADQTPWFDRNSRYCTSDQKTAPIKRLISELGGVNRKGEEANLFIPADRALVEDIAAQVQRRARREARPVRILNCLGLRAEESVTRAKKPEFQVERDTRALHVLRWHPILAWSEARVWDTIKAHNLPWHWAYDAGMERLSCVICPLARRVDNILGAALNPELAQEYLALETEVGGFPIREDGFSMKDIVAAADRLRAERGLGAPVAA